MPCSNELALLYNDLSPLENHHLATSFKVLQRKDCNFLKRMPKDKQVGLLSALLRPSWQGLPCERHMLTQLQRSLCSPRPLPLPVLFISCRRGVLFVASSQVAVRNSLFSVGQQWDMLAETFVSRTTLAQLSHSTCSGHDGLLGTWGSCRRQCSEVMHLSGTAQALHWMWFLPCAGTAAEDGDRDDPGN